MLSCLIGGEVTALAGQPFIVAFEARDAAGNLMPGAEVSMRASDGAVAVRFESGRPYAMKKTGRVGASKGVVEVGVVAPQQEFEIFAKCGAETAVTAVKVIASAIVATPSGGAIRGADGRLYAMPAHQPGAVAFVGAAPAALPAVTAVPMCGPDIVIIDI